jgi:hypothetical protein
MRDAGRNNRPAAADRERRPALARFRQVGGQRDDIRRIGPDVGVQRRKVGFQRRNVGE